MGDLLHGQLNPRAELKEGHQGEDAECDPDLGEDGVSGCAEEFLEFQVLLDPFEKQLDLPPAVVDVGDGLSA